MDNNYVPALIEAVLSNHYSQPPALDFSLHTHLPVIIKSHFRRGGIEMLELIRSNKSKDVSNNLLVEIIISLLPVPCSTLSPFFL